MSATSVRRIERRPDEGDRVLVSVSELKGIDGDLGTAVLGMTRRGEIPFFAPKEGGENDPFIEIGVLSALFGDLHPDQTREDTLLFRRVMGRAAGGNREHYDMMGRRRWGFRAATKVPERRNGTDWERLQATVQYPATDEDRANGATPHMNLFAQMVYEVWLQDGRVNNKGKIRIYRFELPEGNTTSFTRKGFDYCNPDKDVAIFGVAGAADMRHQSIKKGNTDLARRDPEAEARYIRAKKFQISYPRRNIRLPSMRAIGALYHTMTKAIGRKEEGQKGVGTSYANIETIAEKMFGTRNVQLLGRVFEEAGVQPSSPDIYVPRDVTHGVVIPLLDNLVAQQYLTLAK